MQGKTRSGAPSYHTLNAHTSNKNTLIITPNFKPRKRQVASKSALDFIAGVAGAMLVLLIFLAYVA